MMEPEFTENLTSVRKCQAVLEDAMSSRAEREEALVSLAASYRTKQGKLTPANVTEAVKRDALALHATEEEPLRSLAKALLKLLPKVRLTFSGVGPGLVDAREIDAADLPTDSCEDNEGGSLALGLELPWRTFLPPESSEAGGRREASAASTASEVSDAPVGGAREARAESDAPVWETSDSSAGAMELDEVGKRESGAHAITGLEMELDSAWTTQGASAADDMELDMGPRGSSTPVEGVSGEKRPLQDRGDWTPGENVGSWVARGRHGNHVGEQSQVLLVNAYRRLQNLPEHVLKAMIAKNPPIGSKGSTNLAGQALSGLVRLPARTIENQDKFIRQNKNRPGQRPPVKRTVLSTASAGASTGASTAGAGLSAATARASTGVSTAGAGLSTALQVDPTWAQPGGGAEAAPVAEATAPAYEEGGSKDAKDGAADGEAGEEAGGNVQRVGPGTQGGVPSGFVNLVRITQFMATHGIPRRLLPGLCLLVRKSGGDVGKSSHSQRFAQIAEFTGDQLLLKRTLQAMNTPLAGTGRPPDLSWMLDAGTIGKYFTRYFTVIHVIIYIRYI